MIRAVAISLKLPVFMATVMPRSKLRVAGSSTFTLGLATGGIGARGIAPPVNEGARGKEAETRVVPEVVDVAANCVA